MSEWPSCHLVLISARLCTPEGLCGSKNPLLIGVIRVISLSSRLLFVGMIGGQSHILYTLWCCHWYDVMESTWLKSCYRSMVSDLCGVHGLGGQPDLEMFDLNCGALRFWQEPGAGKICTGYFCQEPIFLELFFGQVLWPCGLLCPLNRPFRHPCQFECGAIAFSANSFSPFLLGIFRTRSLSWSFWQTDVLEAFFCSRNCAMCQLARMLYGRTFKWLIDAPLVWRVTFCDCCLDRFLRLNGIFVFLMASMSTITSCWCYEEKINDRLRESSTSQVHPSAWGVKLLFLESVETTWGDEECSSYTASYIYIVYLISYTYTSVHIFS